MQKKNSNITTFAILTTLTLITWVTIEAYQHFFKSDIQTVPTQILAPLTPILDSEYINELTKRKQITQQDTAQYKGNAKVQISSQEARPTPLPTAAASSSATVATQGGIER